MAEEPQTADEFIDASEDTETLDRLLQEQNAIFRTLSRNFKNLYLVNLQDETANVLKYGNEYLYANLDSFEGRAFPYAALMGEWIEAQVHPDDREMLRTALSPEHLRETFASKEELLGNYRMLIDGKTINYQFNLSKSEVEGYIIAGFQGIEGIIQEHLEQEKKQREID